jgi:hypothetical protein
MNSVDVSIHILEERNLLPARVVLKVVYEINVESSWGSNLSEVLLEYDQEIGNFDISGRKLALVKVSGLNILTSREDESSCRATDIAKKVLAFFQSVGLKVIFTVMAPNEVNLLTISYMPFI